MRTHLVAIGNSRGVRIPKTLIEQTGLSAEVEMEVRDHAILIRRPDEVRAGWEQAFARMAQNRDDKLLDELQAGTADWDNEEWQW